MTTPGRFTTIAALTPASPVGVSPREGRALVAWAAFQLLALAVLFQAANVPGRGGLLTFATLAAFLVGQLILSARVAGARQVHPRGFNTATRLAGVWAVLVVVVAGWFWIAQGPHDGPATATTLVAAVATAPYLVLARRLLKAAQ